MPKIVDHGVRKAEISRAVISSITKQGLANVTIRGIAREGGFSSGTLAHYFSNKEELIDFAFDEVAQASFTRIRTRVLGIPSALGKVRVVIEELTPNISDDHDAVVSVMFWAAARQDERLKAKFHQVYELLRAHLRDYIGQGMTDGEIASVEDIEDEVDFIIAVTDGLLVSFLLDPERFPVERSERLVKAAMSRLS